MGWSIIDSDGGINDVSGGLGVELGSFEVGSLGGSENIWVLTISAVESEEVLKDDSGSCDGIIKSLLVVGGNGIVVGGNFVAAVFEHVDEPLGPGELVGECHRTQRGVF